MGTNKYTHYFKEYKSPTFILTNFFLPNLNKGKRKIFMTSSKFANILKPLPWKDKKAAHSHSTGYLIPLLLRLS